MNLAIEKDIKLLNERVKQQQEDEGVEFTNLRNFIETQTKEGEIMVSSFIKGENPFPIEKKSDQKFLSNAIMQLIYFRFNIIMSKEIFLSWHSDESGFSQLSDECYRKFAEDVKIGHTLQESEAIEDLMEFLLILKLGDDYTDEKAIKIYKICRKIVGNKLLKGKFLKSLKTKKSVE